MSISTPIHSAQCSNILSAPAEADESQETTVDKEQEVMNRGLFDSFGSVSPKVNQEGMLRDRSQEKGISETEIITKDRAEQKTQKGVEGDHGSPKSVHQDSLALCSNGSDIAKNMETTGSCDKKESPQNNSGSDQVNSQLSNCTPLTGSAEVGVFGLLDDNWSDDEWSQERDIGAEEVDPNRWQSGMTDDQTAPEKLNERQTDCQTTNNSQREHCNSGHGNYQAAPNLTAGLPNTGIQHSAPYMGQSQGAVSLVSTTDTMYSSQDTASDEVPKSPEETPENGEQNSSDLLKTPSHLAAAIHPCTLSQNQVRHANTSNSDQYASPELFGTELRESSGMQVVELHQESSVLLNTVETDGM